MINDEKLHHPLRNDINNLLNLLVKFKESATFANTKIVCMHTINCCYVMKWNDVAKAGQQEHKKSLPNGKACVKVVMDGIEPPTQGFSVLCSTN